MKSLFPYAAEDLIVCGLEFFLHLYVPLLLQVLFTVEKPHSCRGIFVVAELY